MRKEEENQRKESEKGEGVVLDRIEIAGCLRQQGCAIAAGRTCLPAVAVS